MKAIITLFFGTVLTFLIGCKTSEPITVIYDSITEITTLDTIYLVSPADTLYLQIPVELPLEDLIIINETPGPSVEIKIEDGVMEVWAYCPEDSLMAIITELESKGTKTIYVDKIIEVNKMPKIGWYSIIFNVCVLIYIGVRVYTKIKAGALSALIKRIK